MTSKKLHSVALPKAFNVVYRTAPFLSVLKWVLGEIEANRLSDTDVLYIVPSANKFIPSTRERYKNQQYRCAINDGSSIRYKCGSLVPLLKWCLNEAYLGRISGEDSVFISVKVGRMPWEK